MISIYQLRRAKQHIEQVQRATLTTWKFGVAKTHGLFGSDKWWQNIDSGKLKLHTLRGVITRLYMGSMGDWPEFSMRTDSGKEFSFSRYANSGELSEFYAVGRQIEIDYVLQRDRLFGYGSFFTRHKVVIEVRIGAALNPAPASGQPQRG